MKFIEKLQLGCSDLYEYGPINVVVLGDSVTHGCQAPGVYDYDHVYWRVLERMLHKTYPEMPINMINSAINGTTSKRTLPRMDRDVWKHQPDLLIVCFGLNDVNYPIEEYRESLSTIFESCYQHHTEAIMMTPNMLNTYVDKSTPLKYYEYGKVTASYQNDGKMDEYMQAARNCVKAVNEKHPESECTLRLCDCYAKWKELASQGIDTTKLLANGINHPTSKMHELFASELYRLITGKEEVPSL